MKILVFDLKGVYAHFRKIYTNSSSLSYYFPPPTTIAGMVAAILGKERDSYYTEFGMDNFKVGIRILKPLRKMTHTLNYIKLKGPKDLYNRKDPTQIPFEILTGEEDEVEYRVYFWHKDICLLEELSERIQNKKFAFPPYLGAAPFSCSVTGGRIVFAEMQNSNDIVAVHSVVNLEYAEKDSIKATPEITRLIKDIVPLYFNADRVVQKTAGVIFDEKCAPIKLKLNTGFLNILGENIVYI